MRIFSSSSSQGASNPLIGETRNMPNTTDSLVVDGVYAINGVINSINQQYSIYPDPNSTAVNSTGPVILPSQSVQTEWFSELMDDDINSTYELAFQFNRTTFLNYVTFDLADVPCSWALWQGDENNGTVLARGVNQSFQDGGWNHYKVNFRGTYQFDSTTPLLLIINKLSTGTQYSFGVRNFLTKLKVQNYDDINNPYILSSGVVTQNSLGFVEQYTPFVNSITNLTTSDITDYWKSSPQPVGDAIVHFTVDLTTYSIPNNLLTSGTWSAGQHTSNPISTVSVTGVNPSYNTAQFVTANASGLAWFTNATHFVASSGQKFSATAQIYPVDTAISGYLNIAFFTSGGSFISDKYMNVPMSSANQWNTIVATGLVAPANTGYGTLSIRTANVASGQAFYSNAAAVIQGSTAPVITAYPQSINRLYIDPLYTGNALNLYYSNDNINWSSVQRDFVLRKGIYELPTIYARYIKFEITNLTPEPYDLPFDSIERTISVFPDSVDNYFSNIELSIPDVGSQQYFFLNENVIAPTYNTQLTSTTIFGSASSQLESPIWGSTDQNALTSYSNLPSTVTDPTTSYKSVLGISDIGSTYTDPGSAEFIQRRFYQYGPHDYKNVTLAQTWHQAYFTGIKQLNLYSIDQTVQNDYEEINDYFLSTNSIVDNSLTTATLTSGGYTGLAGSLIQTKNLQSISQYNSFKLAGLSTDWIPFLTPEQTKMVDSSILSNIAGAVGTIDKSNYNESTYVGYGILTVSGSTGTSSVTSALGGGQNLMTTAMATFAASDGWSPNQNTGTISGTAAVTLPLVTTTQWGNAIGEAPYGFGSIGETSAISSASNTYTFLTTCSGINGTVTVELDFYNSSTSSNTVVTSGFTVAASGTQISFTYVQPTNTNAVRFKLTPSNSSATYSNAGFFLGSSAVWVAPLVTTNMRISATARIFLPFTNNGSYRCSIYSGTTELAYKQVNNIPTRTWVDIEVPFTLLGSNANNTFTAKVTQINGNREVYQLALLGLFYNPVSYEFSTDGGTNWTAITTGINNPDALINFTDLTKQLKLRMYILKDNAFLSSISIVPNYKQNAYSTKTVINYLGDNKTNELSWRRAPRQKPLFQLRQYLHPYEYDISVLMGIPNPYKLS